MSGTNVGHSQYSGKEEKFVEGRSGEMDGNVVQITGGTGGIGKEMAVGLAKRGAHVVLVGRDKEKGHAAVSDIENRTW